MIKTRLGLPAAREGGAILAASSAGLTDYCERCCCERAAALSPACSAFSPLALYLSLSLTPSRGRYERERETRTVEAGSRRGWWERARERRRNTHTAAAAAALTPALSLPGFISLRHSSLSLPPRVVGGWMLCSATAAAPLSLLRADLHRELARRWHVYTCSSLSPSIPLHFITLLVSSLARSR